MLCNSCNTDTCAHRCLAKSSSPATPTDSTVANFTLQLRVNLKGKFMKHISLLSSYSGCGYTRACTGIQEVNGYLRWLNCCKLLAGCDSSSPTKGLAHQIQLHGSCLRSINGDLIVAAPLVFIVRFVPVLYLASAMTHANI